MTEAPLTSVDLRTRFDDRPDVVDPVAFLDRELPDLLVRHDGLLASTEHLDLRPLVVRTEHGRWQLERVGTRPTVRRIGDTDAPSGGRSAELHTDGGTIADLAADQITPIAMMTSGALDLRGAGIGRLLDWWLVLRCVLDGRPVHTPGSIRVPDELDRSFSLDDDPTEAREFLLAAGFLHLRGVFSPGEMAAVSAEMDAAVPSYAQGDGNSWWARLEDGSDALVRMQRFDHRSPTTAALLDDERMARIPAITGQQMEPRWSGDGNRIEALFKPIGVREGISDVPWHKDCSLGRHSYRCCSLTVGISVTGAGPGSGQLRVIAGSHRALVWPSLLDTSTLGLPEVALATDTGDVTVHLSCTLHMAEPPTVAERRVMYTDYSLPFPDPDAAEAAAARSRAAREAAPLTTSQ
jgi:hypothetical protein